MFSGWRSNRSAAIPRLPIPRLLRLGRRGESHAITLHHRRDPTAVRRVIQLAVPVADQSRGRRDTLARPPVPGRDQVRLAPQTPPGLPGLLFELLQLLIVPGVPLVPPGHPPADHLPVERPAIRQDDLG